MKKSIKVVIMILAVVMMAGCEVGEGELMKTKTGHLMYLGWTDDINGIVFNIVEPAFNLNAWVQASEDQKPEIFQKHFYSNTVIDVLSDHTWRIRVDGTTASLRVALVNGTSLAEAGAKLGEFLEGVEIRPLQIPYAANYTGAYVTDSAEIRPLLVKQVSGSVRFEQSIRAMLADGVDQFVEIGPGKTIAGFLRKIDRNLKVINIETVEDLEKCRG